MVTFLRYCMRFLEHCSGVAWRIARRADGVAIVLYITVFTN